MKQFFFIMLTVINCNVLTASESNLDETLLNKKIQPNVTNIEQKSQLNNFSSFDPQFIRDEILNKLMWNDIKSVLQVSKTFNSIITGYTVDQISKGLYGLDNKPTKQPMNIGSLVEFQRINTLEPFTSYPSPRFNPQSIKNQKIIDALKFSAKKSKDNSDFYIDNIGINGSNDKLIFRKLYPSRLWYFYLTKVINLTVEGFDLIELSNIQSVHFDHFDANNFRNNKCEFYSFLETLKSTNVIEIGFDYYPCYIEWPFQNLFKSLKESKVKYITLEIFHEELDVLWDWKESLKKCKELGQLKNIKKLNIKSWPRCNANMTHLNNLKKLIESFKLELAIELNDFLTDYIAARDKERKYREEYPYQM